MAQCTPSVHLETTLSPGSGGSTFSGVPAGAFLFQDPVLTSGSFSTQGSVMNRLSHVGSSFQRLTGVSNPPQEPFPLLYHNLLFPPASLPSALPPPPSPRLLLKPPPPPISPSTPTKPEAPFPRAREQTRPKVCLPSGPGRGSWWRGL